MSETSTPNLTKALVAFQADLPRAVKDNTAKVKTKTGADYVYSYADLSDLSPLILPLLAAQGLSWSCLPDRVDGVQVLRYELCHVSGEMKTGQWELPDPKRFDLQAMGSAVTYARRYCLCSVTGVAPGKDDDDAAASSRRQSTGRRSADQSDEGPPPEPEPEQVAAIRDQVLAATTYDQLRALHTHAHHAGALAAQTTTPGGEACTLAELLIAARDALQPKEQAPPAEENGAEHPAGKDTVEQARGAVREAGEAKGWTTVQIGKAYHAQHGIGYGQEKDLRNLRAFVDDIHAGKVTVSA